MCLAIMSASSIHNIKWYMYDVSSHESVSYAQMGEARSYISTGRRFAEGDFVPTELCLFENSDIRYPWVHAPLAAAITAGFVSLFGESGTVIVVDFFLPGLVFLIGTIMFWLLTGNRYFSAAMSGSMWMLQGFSHVFMPPVLKNAWRILQSQWDTDPLMALTSAFKAGFPFFYHTGDWTVATRLHAPMLTSAILLGGIALNAWLCTKPRSLKAWFLVALYSSIGIYIHFTIGLYLIILFGITCILYFIQTDFNQPETLLGGIWGGIVGVLPFGINMIFLGLQPWFAEYSARAGVNETRMPFLDDAWTYALWLLLLIGIFVTSNRRFGMMSTRSRNLLSLVYALIPSLFIVVNSQMLTGKELYSIRTAMYVGPYITFIAFSWILWNVSEKISCIIKQRRDDLTAIVDKTYKCCFLFLFTACLTLVSYDQITTPMPIAGVLNYRYPKDSKEFLDWATQKELPSDSVIMNLTKTHHYVILGFSPYKLFIPYCIGTTASTKEMLERLYIAMRVAGINDFNHFRRCYSEWRNDILLGLQKIPSGSFTVPERYSKISNQEVQQAWLNYLLLPHDLDKLLAGRRVDVIVWTETVEMLTGTKAPEVEEELKKYGFSMKKIAGTEMYVFYRKP